VTGPTTTDQSVVAQLVQVGYDRARRLLVLVGLVILVIVVAGLLARSVDHVEVIGTLLFVPIFLALMYWGVPGGAIAGVAATFVYVVLRSDAIDAVGFGEFAGVVVSRGLGYLLFGVAGGWASSTLELSLEKLELYDTIDDLTGLHNARFLLDDVGLERARSERYETVFSVSFAEIPAAEIGALSARRRRQLLRELGQRLDAAVRTVDRVAHGFDGRVHHVAVVLPETASEGAEIFHDRLVAQLREFFAGRDVDTLPTGDACTVPGDDARLEERLDAWRRIDAAQHAS
jgi:GGDEF domain-containing protein